MIKKNKKIMFRLFFSKKFCYNFFKLPKIAKNCKKMQKMQKLQKMQKMQKSVHKKNEKNVFLVKMGISKNGPFFKFYNWPFVMCFFYFSFEKSRNFCFIFFL